MANFGGLLGYELFMRFVIQVDYQRKQLILTLPEQYRYAGDGLVIPFEFNYNLPEVQGTVDGLAGKFNLDTGNTGALILYTPFVEQHRLVERYLPRESLTAEGSAGGTVTILPVQVGELSLGALRAIDLPAGLSRQPRGALCNPYAAGLVGSELFSRYTMIFDYTRQQVIFAEAGQQRADDLPQSCNEC